ncbi:hypothetical protein AX14_005701 [Amanita brunnescens Koide BX004]|nr:hypothetical protein AX14_005701 [Amanita brunnescens Koide BX004]
MLHANLGPLSNIRLSHPTKLDLGGHYLLTQIINSLTLPALTDITVDIEARDSIEENIVGLVMHSHYPLFGEMTHQKSLHIGGTLPPAALDPACALVGGVGMSRAGGARDEELQCAQRVGSEDL